MWDWFSFACGLAAATLGWAMVLILGRAADIDAGRVPRGGE